MEEDARRYLPRTSVPSLFVETLLRIVVDGDPEGVAAMRDEYKDKTTTDHMIHPGWYSATVSTQLVDRCQRVPRKRLARGDSVVQHWGGMPS